MADQGSFNSGVEIHNDSGDRLSGGMANIESAVSQSVGPHLGSDGMTYAVAFLNVTIDEASGNTVGGLLVSDNIGVPLEFVITNAVRPTPAQRVLYGKSLKRHVSTELCGRQLLQHLLLNHFLHQHRCTLKK